MPVVLADRRRLVGVLRLAATHQVSFSEIVGVEHPVTELDDVVEGLVAAPVREVGTELSPAQGVPQLGSDLRHRVAVLEGDLVRCTASLAARPAEAEPAARTGTAAHRRGRRRRHRPVGGRDGARVAHRLVVVSVDRRPVVDGVRVVGSENQRHSNHDGHHHKCLRPAQPTIPHCASCSIVDSARN